MTEQNFKVKVTHSWHDYTHLSGNMKLLVISKEPVLEVKNNATYIKKKKNSLIQIGISPFAYIE